MLREGDVGPFTVTLFTGTIQLQPEFQHEAAWTNACALEADHECLLHSKPLLSPRCVLAKKTFLEGYYDFSKMKIKMFP